MASKSEIQAQMDALAAQLESATDDDDYEVWVKNDKGHETKLPASKAGGWLKENFGIDLNPVAGGDAGDQGDDDQGDAGGKAKGNAGYFKGK